MTSQSETSRPAVAGWLAITAVGLVVAFLVAFAIATVPGRLGIDVATVGAGLRLDLALWLILFGVLGMAVVRAAAQLAFGAVRSVTAGDIGLPAVGIGLAVAEELALHEWAESSLGYYDWDFIGWTAALSILLVLIAIGWFAALVAPAGATRYPRAALVAAAAVVCLIVASNLPALQDGIGPHSWPVAIAVGLSAAFAVATAASAWRLPSR